MGIRVKQNDDKALVLKIRSKLKDNGGYCPCVLTRRDEDKCICKAFRDQMEQGIEGECHCGLYVLLKD